MFDGKKLRALREVKGLTMQELGIKMRPERPIPLTTIWGWESRKYSNVQLATLLDACRVLDCCVYDLMSDELGREHKPAVEQFIKSRRRR